MKISTDWLNDYVAFKSPPEGLAERLTMAGLEVKAVEKSSHTEGQILEIEVTSNRPDWLSYVGVAREVAALTGARLSFPAWENKIPRRTHQDFQVEIRDLKLCPYYSACLIEGVEFGESPASIKERLRAVGMRPINLIVDITNYVLLEMGQPLHAFDKDKLIPSKIVVRRAQEGERIKAIDGTEYVLDIQDLLIADSDHPIAIAGVMGGIESEVGPATKNILLESAYFSSASVRKTSRKLNLVSESSYHFERGVDPLTVDKARERAIYLIRKFAEKIGRISPVYRAGRPPLKKATISFPLSEIKRILGVEIPMAKVSHYLRSLGLEVRPKKAKTFSVEVPSFRQDLRLSVDLVEEVARLHGYDRIPESLPFLEPIAPQIDIALEVEDKTRGVLLGAGFNEVITFSLINERIFEKLGVDLSQATRIINPQNKELTLMRPTFIPSLLEVAKTNFNHSNLMELEIFEIANVYGPEQNKNLPHEDLTLGIALTGSWEAHWLEKGRKHSLFDLKGVFEEIFLVNGVSQFEFLPTSHPFFNQAFSILVKGKALGVLGKISPKVQEFYDIPSEIFLGEVSLEKLSSSVSSCQVFKALPQYPSSKRDIAVILKEEVPAKDVIDLIESLHLQAIKKIQVMDLYRGEKIPMGKKSLAFSIAYRADDHTLTAEEIHQFHSQVVNSVVSHFKAELRA